MENYLMIFSASLTAGFLFFSWFSGRREGDKIERSLRFFWAGRCIHLHHWFLASIFLILAVIFNAAGPVLLGFLSGSAIQVLKYKDRFLFVYPKDKFQEIYEKWQSKA